MAHLLGGVSFVPDNIDMDPGIHAAGRANRLVLEEGTEFPGCLPARGGGTARETMSEVRPRPACLPEPAARRLRPERRIFTCHPKLKLSRKRLMRPR